MSAPVLTFFNNKGGVGKTSLIYHLAWMFASLNKRVVIADLDPQANLTAAFLSEDQIENIWNGPESGSTVYQCVQPLMNVGDLVNPVLQNIDHNLYLLPGDVALSDFENTLSESWPKSSDDKGLYRHMRILTAFWQVMQMGAEEVKADIILVDVGPNLGAINRSVLLATDYVAIPLGADLFSLQGLKNLGPTLGDWRKSWINRVSNWNSSKEAKNYPDFRLPDGQMKPIGYLCQQYGVRLDRPIKAYDKWVLRIPGLYRAMVLDQKTGEDAGLTPESDPYCLSMIKHYRSLISMGQEYRKPIFNLTSADGAIGAHANAVADSKKDFRLLATKIAQKIGLQV